jgi:hypothetical protein
MRKFMRYATVPMSIAALSACADQSSGPTGPQGNLNLSVAPLSLPGIDDADYAIVVENGAGDIVWQEEALTSNQYGDGAGSLTYIGACDADEPLHTVSLTTKTLTDSDGTELFAAGEAVNPCPAASPCQLTATCAENEDVFVEFNLAIMRDANQGFFDIAVNFQDIFCSAKVDCQDALLHNAAGVRAPTAVIGFACTSGGSSTSAQEPTVLYVDFQANGVGLDEKIDGNSPDGSYAIYQDDEELAGYTKGFWNAAVLIPAGGVEITGVATAAPGALPTEAPGTFNNYPVIGFNVTVNQDCTGAAFPVQLDSGDGVDTFYSDDPAGEGTYSARTVAAPGLN